MLTQKGADFWKGLEEKGIAKNGIIERFKPPPPKGQRGSIDPEVYKEAVKLFGSKIVDAYVKFQEIMKRPFVDKDPYLASTGNKAAATRAFNKFAKAVEEANLDLGKVSTTITGLEIDIPMNKNRGQGKKMSGAWTPFESSKSKKNLPGGVKSFDEYAQKAKQAGFDDETILKTWLNQGGPRPDPIVSDPKVAAMSKAIGKLDKNQQRAYDELGQRVREYEEVKPQIKNEPDYYDGPGSSVRGLVGLNEQAASTKYTAIRWAIGNILGGLRKWENAMNNELFHGKSGMFQEIEKLLKTDPAGFADLWARQRAMEGKGFADNLTPLQKALWDRRQKLNEWKWNETLRLVKENHPERYESIAKRRVNYFNDDIRGSWVFQVLNKDRDVIKIIGEETRAKADQARKWFEQSTKDVEGVIVEPISYRPEMQQLLKGKGMDKIEKILAFEELAEIGAKTKEGQIIQERKTAYEQQLAWDYLQEKNRLKGKKGVNVAPGNKPWKSGMENAVEGWNHWLRSMENFAEWAGYQEATASVRKFLDDPEMANKVNTKKRIQDILAQAFDQQTGWTDHMVDAAANSLGKQFGTSAQIIKSVPKEARQLGIFWHLTTLKNFFAQEIQPAIAYPTWITMLKGKYKMEGDPFVPATLGATVQAFIHMHSKDWWSTGELNMPRVEKFLGKDIASILKCGQDNGVLTSHILEKRELKLNQTKFEKGKEVVEKGGDLFISRPDSATRAGYFVAMVKFLESSGFPREEALSFASNLDKLGMVDYNTYNIPNVYKSMGKEVGAQGASLTRFKHNQYWQYQFTASKYPPAFMMAMALQFSIAGLMGMPFREELDAIWRMFQKVGAVDATAPTPSAMLLQKTNVSPLYAWGPASYTTGYDFSTPLGSPNPIPDSLTEGVMPMLDFYSRMANLPVDAISGFAQDNPTKIKRAINDATPPQFKVFSESNMFGEKRRTPEGVRYDLFDPKTGKYIYTRDEKDIWMRATGGRSLEESQSMQRRFSNRQDDAVIVKRMESLRQKYNDMRDQYSFFDPKLKDIKKEYMELGGNLEALEKSYRTGKIVMEPEVKSLGGKATVDKARRFERAQDQGIIERR
jgi:hypothetical protein